MKKNPGVLLLVLVLLVMALAGVWGAVAAWRSPVGTSDDNFPLVTLCRQAS